MWIIETCVGLKFTFTGDVELMQHLRSLYIIVKVNPKLSNEHLFGQTRA